MRSEIEKYNKSVKSGEAEGDVVHFVHFTDELSFLKIFGNASHTFSKNKLG